MWRFVAIPSGSPAGIQNVTFRHQGPRVFVLCRDGTARANYQISELFYSLSLSSTWEGVDQHASHDSDGSGVLCFALDSTSVPQMDRQPSSVLSGRWRWGGPWRAALVGTYPMPS